MNSKLSFQTKHIVSKLQYYLYPVDRLLSELASYQMTSEQMQFSMHFFRLWLEFPAK